MTLSIKSVGGLINEVPKIKNMAAIKISTKFIKIQYQVEDLESIAFQHFITVKKNGTEVVMNHVDITDKVMFDKTNFSYVIENLEFSTNYTIQVFCYDGFDESRSDIFSTKTSSAVIYGIEVDETNPDPQARCTYIEEAIDVTPASKTNLGGWVDKYPFKNIRIVGFKNGKVVKEVRKDDKTRYVDGSGVGSEVDVMVEIPKVYWDFEATQKGYKLRISDEKFNKTCDCYAHKVGGVEKDFIYVGAYLGHLSNGKIRSISGVTPTSDLNIADFRSGAQVNGNGYQIWNWFTMTLIQILFIIAYKNFDSQSALGVGIANTTLRLTGGTNTKGFIYGNHNSTEQVCFIGIEDAWGNLSQYIDGMVNNVKRHLIVNTNNKGFKDVESGDLPGFTDAGSTGNNNVYGFPSSVMHTNLGGFFPMVVNGSETTHYCDYNYTNTGGMGCSGGAHKETNIRKNGIFNYRGGYSGNRSDEVGTRLVYLGE